MIVLLSIYLSIYPFSSYECKDVYVYIYIYYMFVSVILGFILYAWKNKVDKPKEVFGEIKTKY